MLTLSTVFQTSSVSRTQCLLFVLLVTFASCGESHANQKRSADRPNILLLLADNWAWPHAGRCGDRSVKTPTFDAIADNGVHFTHTFCQVPSCSPARAVLLTGQASHRLSDAANLWGNFPERLSSYPLELQKHGYQAGYMIKGWGPGRFHGERHTARNPAGKKFDSFGEFLDKLPNGDPFCFWFGSHDPHQPWNRGDDFRGELDPAKIDVPPSLPDHAIVREMITDYYAEIQRFDSECGEMLELLKKKALLENTIVIMVGDNGWQVPRGLANVYDFGTRVPMAMQWGNKIKGGQECHEFISFEDFAPTFLTAAGLDAPTDATGKSFLPLIDWQDQPSNADDQETDKNSTTTKVDLLSRSKNRIEWPQQVFLERERHANVRAGNATYPCRAIRTKRYLLIQNLTPDRWPAGDPTTHWAVGPFGDVDNTPVKSLILSERDGRMKPFFEMGFAKRPSVELYDLRNDPYQMKNVANEKKYAGAKKILAARLFDWRVRTKDPRLNSANKDYFDRMSYFGKPAKKPPQ